MTKPPNALVVHVFGYPRATAGTGPDDDGVKPLPGEEVSITAQAGGAIIKETTGADGTASFTGLTEGDYQVDVTTKPPTGYQIPIGPEFFRDGRPWPLATNIPVPRGGEVVVHVGLTPLPATIEGSVTIPDPGGGPTTTPVEDVTVEAWSGERFMGTAQTDKTKAKAGQFTLPALDQPGLVEVRLVAPFTDVAGRTHEPAPGSASRFIYVPPGATVKDVELQYALTRAAVEVGAHLVERVDGQRQRRPLAGVVFRLFKLSDERPHAELTTHLQTATVFRDLPADSYRLVAEAPQGRNGQRLRMTRPPGPDVTFRVQDGERLDLKDEFEFQPLTGSVLGSVIIGHDNTPVPGVAVVLTSQQEPQVVKRVVTDDEGEFSVTDLPEGDYQAALEQQVMNAFGRRWMVEPLPGASDNSRTIELRGRATVVVQPFRLTEDEHVISGRVIEPGGRGASFVTVQVLSDSNPSGKVMDNVLTDGEGYYRFRAPTAGTYFLRVRERDGVAPQLLPVTVDSPVTADDLVTSTQTGTQAVARARADEPRSAPVPSDNDFPFLTQEVEVDGRVGGGHQPGGVAGGVGRMVEREIREVLGWRPRAADAKGFQAALQQAFTVREVAGHTEVEWQPRSYSVDIQADLGAITGAQASIHTRAKGTLDQVLPLLDGLVPLRVDADDENVAAVRAIVRTQLTELVTELGLEGGPRVQRVDQFLSLLLDDALTAWMGQRSYGALRDPAQVGGSLGVLRDRLGLLRERINTIDEEQNFTNFLVVIDHVVGLAESWDAQRDFFVRGGSVEPFLGTQLVLLARDLEVIAESVHEVEFSMDSVFLGPAERQTLELQFPSTPGTTAPPMFVSELLSWVERFANDEGRQLIDEGGRHGVAAAFRPALRLLQELVEDSLVQPAGFQDPSRMPAAYRRQRVQRALAELAQQLRAAGDRVQLIKVPVDDGHQPAPAVAPTPPVDAPARARPRRIFPGTDGGRPFQPSNGGPVT